MLKHSDALTQIAPASIVAVRWIKTSLSTYSRKILMRQQASCEEIVLHKSVCLVQLLGTDPCMQCTHGSAVPTFVRA